MRLQTIATGCLCLAGVLATATLLRPTNVHAAGPAKTYTPTYNKDGSLIAPQDYREWVFLTSGFDMTYRERAPGVPDHSVFDNVFVNPEAYAAFKKTGTWPDKTVMVLENRVAQSKDGVIVKGGRFQNTEIAGMEIHIKDSSRFKRVGPDGTWGFFDVDFKAGTSTAFEPTASCFTCHRDHAAVDTTFVQFYPILLPIAQTKATLSDNYKKDLATVPPAK